MITVRKSKDRGHTDLGWLDSHHTFSFGHYHDPAHMGFRSLRVINDDRVAPGRGFATHPHHDMEIFSLVLEGEMKHRDSMGNGSLVRAGELQKMSAGTGVTHSEFNASDSKPLHFYQIWIEPERRGIVPEYGQIALNGSADKPGLRLIAAPGGSEGVINLHQDARIYLGRLEPGGSLTQPLADDRHAWLQIIEGDLWVNGAELHDADGVAVSDEMQLELASARGARFLVFDLA